MSDELARRVLEVALADLEAEARRRTQAHASEQPNLLDAARAWAALHVLERERKLSAAVREAYALLRAIEGIRPEALAGAFADADEQATWREGYRDWCERWLAGGEDLLG